MWKLNLREVKLIAIDKIQTQAGLTPKSKIPSPPPHQTPFSGRKVFASRARYCTAKNSGCAPLCTLKVIMDVKVVLNCKALGLS